MNDKLPGDYIAGFVDGEGCFALNFRKDTRHERNSKPTYYSWKLQFSIVLRKDDAHILESIRQSLKCGNISFTTNGTVRYQVTNVNELHQKIVPFFEKFKLHAKKKFDFQLWSEAVKIIFTTKRKEVNVEKGVAGFTKTIWNPDDIARLEEIYQEMLKYKSGSRLAKWIGESNLHKTNII